MSGFPIQLVMVSIVFLCFFAALLLGVSWIAQTLADWATDAKKAHFAGGGFPVLDAHARPSALRFAVLYHAGVTLPHFDLLFEPASGEPLVSWRSPTWPITRATSIDRQPDHRPHYLDYEGPVSPGPDGADRGYVRRVAAGTFVSNAASDRLWDVTLGDGIRLTFRRQGETATWFAEVGQPA